MEQLSGKVAVVTGGASGIGRALAERFGSEGMRVVLADVEADALDESARALQDAGVEVVAVPTDVSDPDAVDALAGAVRDHFGAYHVVCNNAGVGGHFGRSWEMPLHEWRWVLDVNLWGVIHGIRSFVPGLVAQGEGHVVNTASLAGWLTVPSMAAYCASKHAVLAISETLRTELDALETGVGVSVVCPGTINTRIMSSERNWPARLGHEPVVPDDALTAEVRKLLIAGTTEGDVMPSAVAEAVVSGIRANRFLVTTHADELLAAAEARVALARAIGDEPGAGSPEAAWWAGGLSTDGPAAS